MDALAPFVVHIAANPVGMVQSCSACGWPLMDNTAWTEGRVAVPDADAGRGPSWWPAGQRIATDKPTPDRGGVTYTVNDRPLGDDERLCAGTN